jgi:hypothetical protein
MKEFSEVISFTCSFLGIWGIGYGETLHKFIVLSISAIVKISDPLSFLADAGGPALTLRVKVIMPD